MQVSAVRRRSVDGVFVGRRGELARLDALLGDRGPSVLFLHGLAGSGKSTLLQQFGARLDGTGALLVDLDCRSVEPTEQGFFAALGAAAGAVGGLDEGAVPDRIGRLAELAARVVLSLDQYEVLRLLDTWLRQVLMQSLPDNVRLVLAGREAPNAAWARLPTGTFEALQLGPLTRRESIELLESVGVGADDVPVIMRFAGGHPLTLLLAALAVKEQSPLPVQDVTMDRLIDEFALAYLDELDDETRNLLEAASVVRRVSRSLIASMLPDVDAREAFERLRALPFVDVTAEGLALHESLQQAIAARLRAADPRWHRTLRQRAWTHLRAELRQAPRPELWRYTADMIYLLENREVREAHFPSGGHQYAIEPATPADADDIEAITALHEPPTAAALLRRWWTRCPEAFRVARDQQGRVAGFSIMTTSGRHDPRRFADDPVVAGWLEHLRREPIPASQEVLLIRRWLTRESGDGPCDVQGAFWLDIKRSYMELRPHLRRNYATANCPEVYVPVLAPLSGGLIPDGVVKIDGRAYYGLFLEFGPSSVDGWLTRIAADELGLPEDDLLDMRRRQLLVDGQRIDLTSLEFEVLHYLRQHEGAPVPRYALLTDVWGYKADLASNVVEAVVHSLRKKLGARSSMIETVRGVGYRLR